MRVLKLLVAYDGTDFHGFAAQPEQRTVAGVLGDALAKVLRTPEARPHVRGSHRRRRARVGPGRRSVVAGAGSGIDVDRVARSLNGMLGPEIVVRDAESWVARGSTPAARPPGAPTGTRSSTGRCPTRSSPGTRGGCRNRSTCTCCAWPPTRSSASTTSPSFCRKGPEGSTSVRRVLDSDWHDLGDGILRYDIRATAFCWRMVRSIVGTIVDVGLGKLPPERHAAHPARPRPHRGRPRRPAPGPLPLGRRLRVRPSAPEPGPTSGISTLPGGVSPG